MGYVVRYNDDAVRSDCLGPVCCDLSMKKTGVNTGMFDLDVSVAENCSRRNCACRSVSCCDCCFSCIFRFEVLRIDLDAVSCVSKDACCQFMRSLAVITVGICGNKHRSVKACYDCPFVLMSVNDEVGLVERRAAPQVDKDQNVIRVFECGYSIQHLSSEIVRALAWL